ncbi:MAG: RNA 2',3'-cyclic phosphodiesterase [Actinobacteria bacterium]|nr:MAG: RNA 2',3'-cyclic phosphodiesterase [Actinomycetota bacterium]
MTRLFVAIDFEQKTKKRLEDFTKKLDIKDARVVPAKNIHITVKFLGYVEESILPEIKKVLSSIANKHGPFNVTLDRLGAFPSKRKGRIFWLGSRKNEAANSFADDLDKKFQALGFKLEKRAFKIHLTLARLKKPINLEKATNAKISSVDQKVSHISLFESKITPKGAQYRVLEKYYLKRA